MMEVSAKAHHSALWWPVLISGLGAKRHGFTYWIRRIFIAHQPAHSPQRKEYFYRCNMTVNRIHCITYKIPLPVVCRASTGSHLFFKSLRYRLDLPPCHGSRVCHASHNEFYRPLPFASSWRPVTSPAWSASTVCLK